MLACSVSLLCLGAQPSRDSCKGPCVLPCVSSAASARALAGFALSRPPGDRGICESKPPGGGTPLGCPVVVPVLGAALHLPSPAVWRPGPPGPAAQGLLGERRRRLHLGHVLPQVSWGIKGQSGRCWVLFEHIWFTAAFSVPLHVCSPLGHGVMASEPSVF